MLEFNTSFVAPGRIPFLADKTWANGGFHPETGAEQYGYDSNEYVIHWSAPAHGAVH